MAIVTNNFLVNGLSGMLGQTLVFKTLRGNESFPKSCHD
jgi:hypothetical protein